MVTRFVPLLHIGWCVVLNSCCSQDICCVDLRESRVRLYHAALVRKKTHRQVGLKNALCFFDVFWTYCAVKVKLEICSSWKIKLWSNHPSSTSFEARVVWVWRIPLSFVTSTYGPHACRVFPHTFDTFTIREIWTIQKQVSNQRADYLTEKKHFELKKVGAWKHKNFKATIFPNAT